MTIKQVPIGKDRLSMPVSIVKGAKSNKIVRISTLANIIEAIKGKDSPYKQFSQSLREMRLSNIDEYSKIKSNDCPGFIVGKYEKRSDKNCLTYYPLLGFDIDGLAPDTLEMVIADLEKSDFVFAAFPSPSYHGLRILIWCDAVPETHKKVYGTVSNYLSTLTGIPTDKSLRKEKKPVKKIPHLDTSTSNISRIWFFSHVEENLFYFKLDSKVFVCKEDQSKVKAITKSKKSIVDQKPQSVHLSDSEKIEFCKRKVEAANIPAGRNNFIFSFACELCLHGVPQQSALIECHNYAEDGFTKSEITQSVNSAYKSKVYGKYSDRQIQAYRKKGTYTDNSNGNANGNQKSDNSGKQSTDNNDKSIKKSKFQLIEEYLFTKYEFRFNIIALVAEIRKKDSKEKWEELNENDLIVELMRLGFTGVEASLMAILKSNLVPKYDPLKTYFDKLPDWDESKPDYIKQLARYVRSKDPHWFNQQFKKMLVRCAACALNIIPFNKQCFTLVGKQNDGKTSFVRFLCPDPLQDYYKENLDIQNKDGRIALCTNMFINLDELANFSKYEVTKTKAFFTIKTVKERLPYDRKASTLTRRANFFGSTNSSEFLTDETGNVRWLVFEIDGVRHDNGGDQGYNKNIDINLVWAQANYLLKNGFNFKLTSEEIAKSENNNKSHFVTTIEQELIQKRFLPAKKEDYEEFKTTTEILEELLEEHPKLILSTKKLGQALKLLGFERDQQFLKKSNYQIKGYFLKRIKN